MIPEFSRIFRIDAVGDTDKLFRIIANTVERKALAKRFDLVKIDRLTAEVRFIQRPDGIIANGQMAARYTQRCVATNEPVPAALSVPVDVRFVPEWTGPVADDVVIEVDDCDVMQHDGQCIDVGEATAQTFALAVDPWLRHPDADEILKANGATGKLPTGPFSALNTLKGLLPR